MDNITFNSSIICVDVETIHGDYTEFVLDRACDRTDTNYYKELEKIVDEAVAPWGSCHEVDCYYKVNISIRVPDLDDIDHALKACSEAVAIWLFRYNVNRMVRHENQVYAN
jgi:hypothetical protein